MLIYKKDNDAQNDMIISIFPAKIGGLDLLIRTVSR